MRPDLFPNHVCDELSKLQSGANQHSWAQTQAILKRVLGDEFEGVLQISEDSLVGSGCVAQVYRGKLIKNSKLHPQTRTPNHEDKSESEIEVAVKVLHPGIRDSMELDLRLMTAVASALEWVGELALRLYCAPSVQGKGVVHAVKSTSSLEAYPLRCVSLSESVQTFSAFMQSQLDLTQEGRALDTLK